MYIFEIVKMALLSCWSIKTYVRLMTVTLEVYTYPTTISAFFNYTLQFTLGKQIFGRNVGNGPG